MIPTTTVNISLYTRLGAAAAGARVRLELTHADIDGTTAVQPVPHDIDLDSSGTAQVALWPNERGRKSSRYRLSVYRAGHREPFWRAFATVPEAGPVELTSILTTATR